MGRKSIIAFVTLVALAIPAAAMATGESANLKLPKGTTAINPKTCRFLHREIDPSTPGVGGSLGTTLIALRDLRIYTLYEDARHDAKMACLTHHMGTNGKRGPAGSAGKDGTNGVSGYIRVSASGTGATVTVTCPAGKKVFGGGSPSEIAGSYPSSNTTWTISRDHMSPTTMTAWAVCATA